MFNENERILVFFEFPLTFRFTSESSILSLLHQWTSPVVPVPVTASLLGFVSGYAAVKLLNSVRWRLIRQLLKYQGWIFTPKSKKTLVQLHFRLCRLLFEIYQTHNFEQLKVNLPPILSMFHLNINVPQLYRFSL